MTADAIDQLQQGRTGLFNDWHPPIMSWTWGMFDRVVPGAFGMFLFQLILFWAGWGMLVSLASSQPLTRTFYFLLGFFPPIFMLLSTIMKDVLMTAAFLFGFALILYSRRKKSLGLFTTGLAFLTYGVLTRHNAILAALPLFLYAGWVFTKIKPEVLGHFVPFWRASIVGSVSFIILLLLGNACNTLLTKIKSYPYQQIMVHDLTGISLKIKINLLPSYLASSEQPSLRDLRRIYQLRSMKNLYWPDFTPVHFRILYEPEQVNNLRNIWLTNVIDHPHAYLSHRWAVFAATMGINRNKACSPYYYEETLYKPKGFYQNSDLYYSGTPITDWLFTMVEPLRESPLYWNWLYLLFSLLLLISAFFIILRQRQNENAAIALALSGSGALYGLAYLFAATTCDFRMVLWNVVVTLASFIFLGHTKDEQATMS